MKGKPLCLNFSIKKTHSIHVNDLDPSLGTIHIIDIREPYEFKNGSIKTAKNIPMNDLLTHPNNYLKTDKQYYLMCSSGMRSMRTTTALRKIGYNVINVKGGFGSYSRPSRNS